MSSFLSTRLPSSLSSQNLLSASLHNVLFDMDALASFPQKQTKLLWTFLFWFATFSNMHPYISSLNKRWREPSCPFSLLTRNVSFYWVHLRCLTYGLSESSTMSYPLVNWKKVVLFYSRHAKFSSTILQCCGFVFLLYIVILGVASIKQSQSHFTGPYLNLAMYHYVRMKDKNNELDSNKI